MKNLRSIAAKIVLQILKGETNLSIELQKIKKNYQFLSDKDVSFIKNICFGFFRNFFELDAISKRLLKKNISKKKIMLKVLIMLGVYQIKDMKVPVYAAVNETVNAAKDLNLKWAVRIVNATLRKFERESKKILTTINSVITVKYKHSFWFINKVKRMYPEKWIEILNQNNKKAPLSIRINLQKTSKEKYMEILEHQKITFFDPKINNAGLIIDPAIEIDLIPKFKEGFCSVQDLSAQLVAPLLNPKSNDLILDACSAPGGKTFHLLEIEPKIKKVFALDISKSRLTLLQNDLQRLGMISQNIKIKNSDARDFKDLYKGEKFDKILLDAPCSATGIIRRQPDIKIKNIQQKIGKLNKMQLSLLESLWCMLKVGGILLYTTCSILEEENFLLIDRFLAKTKNAKEKNVDIPFSIRQKAGYQILPRDYFDGFYYCLIEKIF